MKKHRTQKKNQELICHFCRADKIGSKSSSKKYPQPEKRGTDLLFMNNSVWNTVKARS